MGMCEMIRIFMFDGLLRAEHTFENISSNLGIKNGLQSSNSTFTNKT